MTQILVTLEDNSIAPKIMKAIEMLKGVVNISLYEKKEEITSMPSSTHSPRIQRLRGIAKGITQQQIEEDERLAYLLNNTNAPKLIFVTSSLLGTKNILPFLNFPYPIPNLGCIK